jgi:hypothetical protein
VIPKPRTRTLRDIAAHRRRTLASERDMPKLCEGFSCGMLLSKATMVDITIHCARWLGGADVTMATWAISVGAIEHMRRVKAIRSILFLLDATQNSRRPAVLEAAAKVGKVLTVSSHAKVTVLQGAKTGIVLAGSANATRSRGAEWLDLDVDGEYASAVRQALMELVK